VTFQLDKSDNKFSNRDQRWPFTNNSSLFFLRNHILDIFVSTTKKSIHAHKKYPGSQWTENRGIGYLGYIYLKNCIKNTYIQIHTNYLKWQCLKWLAGSPGIHTMPNPFYFSWNKYIKKIFTGKKNLLSAGNFTDSISDDPKMKFPQRVQHSFPNISDVWFAKIVPDSIYYNSEWPLLRTSSV